MNFSLSNDKRKFVAFYFVQHIRFVHRTNMPKTILIAPLNWGIGHATRCIPIIVELEKLGHKIILASDGDALTLLVNRFPHLESELLPSYHISYPKKGGMAFHMLKLLPGILQAINEENRVVRQIIDSQNIDVIISDNRYGVYHHRAQNIFLSHQIRIKAPFGSNILAMLHLRYLHRFNEIWVPDSASKTNVSGNLSHNCKLPKLTRFVGVLSQFSTILSSRKPDDFHLTQPFVLVFISGPEPQRTIFENMVLNQIETSVLPVVIVGGKPNLIGLFRDHNYIHYPFLAPENLSWVIDKAESIISRAGYSSIMDLVSLKKTAVLIPTPGQTEQEYLASHLSSTGMFYEMYQSDFNLNEAIKKHKKLRVNSQLTDVDYTEEFKLALNNI